MLYRCNNKKLFTLLEMVCAVFIFAAIMMVLGTGMATIQKALQKVTVNSDKLISLQALENVFTSSIRNAVPFQWPDPTGVNRSTFVGTPNMVSFAYLHRITDSNDGGIRFIQFYVNNNNLIALYHKVPILPWDQSTLNLAEKEILAKNVESINISYADLVNNQIVWSTSWNPQNSVNIPMAIQIQVRWLDGETEQWLRRTAGSGQFESLGSRTTYEGYEN